MRTHFGPFTLDTSTRQLQRGAEALHLSPKAFDVLSLLVDARPAVLDKNTIHARIWPGTFVVDANLSVLVGEIRRALGDTPQEERFIRTVHRVGYAFSGEVTADSARGAAEARFWLVLGDRRILLGLGDTEIGRDPACGIWLDASGVSRRHARIRLEAERGPAVIEDLKSTNGTFVGGATVSGPIPLRDGDVIQAGSAELTFHCWTGAKLPATERIRRG